MGNTIEHLDSLFTVHVAPYTSQVASLQLLRRCTCATNDHRLHPCYVPSQSQASHPSAYGLSTRPHSVSESPKPRLPALCFTQNSDTRFAPNIFNVVWFSSYRLLGVERGMIYQVDSWIDGLGMMQKCNERSTFAVVAQSAAVEQATE